jgi:uncharacterized protein DUF1707
LIHDATEEELVNIEDATWSGPNRLRTSDAEREQVVTILRAAMTEGRLTLEEGEERLAAAYATKYRDELAPLTADLPGNGRAALADTPQARLATRRGMHRHLRFVISLTLLLTGLWALSGAHFFWPALPLLFLVMGLVRHARWARHPHRYTYAHRIAPWNAPDPG